MGGLKEKIERLTPEKQQEVEDFVDFLLQQLQKKPAEGTGPAHGTGGVDFREASPARAAGLPSSGSPEIPDTAPKAGSSRNVLVDRKDTAPRESRDLFPKAPPGEDILPEYGFYDEGSFPGNERSVPGPKKGPGAILDADKPGATRRPDTGRRSEKGRSEKARELLEWID